jgi:hypothetical protein
VGDRDFDREPIGEGRQVACHLAGR